MKYYGKRLLKTGHLINHYLERKAESLPSQIVVDNQSAIIELSELLENTASRLIANFKDDLDTCNNSELSLIYKWGCDGSSGYSEYKQISNCNADISMVLMAPVVPLN